MRLVACSERPWSLRPSLICSTQLDMGLMTFFPQVSTTPVEGGGMANPLTLRGVGHTTVELSTGGQQHWHWFVIHFQWPVAFVGLSLIWIPCRLNRSVHPAGIELGYK